MTNKSIAKVLKSIAKYQTGGMYCEEHVSEETFRNEIGSTLKLML